MMISMGNTFQLCNRRSYSLTLHFTLCDWGMTLTEQRSRSSNNNQNDLLSLTHVMTRGGTSHLISISAAEEVTILIQTPMDNFRLINLIINNYFRIKKSTTALPVVVVGGRRVLYYPTSIINSDLL